jgi:hypothetical protein
MARKTKEQLALEAQEKTEIVEEDDAYGALSPEQQEKLYQQIDEVGAAYEKAVRGAAMEAARAVQEAVSDENANLLEAMAAIRQEWGDDAVEGSLETDSGIVVRLIVDVSLVRRPSLKLHLDLSCTVRQAENEARAQGAPRRQGAVPNLDEWIFIAIARCVEITVIFMTRREHGRSEVFIKVGARRLRNAKPGRPAWTKETIDRFLAVEFPPLGEGAGFEITWVPEGLSAEDQLAWLVSQGQISMHEMGQA